MPNYKLFYRGDSRAPDVIFQQGFQPKKPTQEAFTVKDMLHTGEDSVSVSENVEGALLFPYAVPALFVDGKAPGKQTNESWLYLVAVDVDQEDTTYLNLYHDLLSASVAEHLFHLHASECVKTHLVKSIAAQHVFAAFKVARQFDISLEASHFQADPTTYRFTEMSQNLGFNLSTLLKDYDMAAMECSDAMNTLAKKLNIEQPYGMSLLPDRQECLRLMYFLHSKQAQRLEQLNSTANQPSSLLARATGLFSRTNQADAAADQQLAGYYQQVIQGDYDNEIKRDEEKLVANVSAVFNKSIKSMPGMIQEKFARQFADVLTEAKCQPMSRQAVVQFHSENDAVAEAVKSRPF